MSSVSRLVVLALASLLEWAQTGCQSHPPDAVAGTGSTPVSLAVGPIPGPPLDSARPKNPFPADEFTLNAGRVYFQRYNCAGCHGDHAGGGMGPSLRDDEWIYGGQDDQVFGSIVEGRAHGMPAWGNKLPDDVVWKLVAYIKSLRTSAEPDQADQTIPPPPEQ
jgi:cytochrome c oxidase cbb3-type subunit III